jgi:hypothetical protein
VDFDATAAPWVQALASLGAEVIIVVGPVE